MDVVALARTFTKDAMERLVSIVTDDGAPPAAQVRAAEVLLDRGWGSAPATILLHGDIVQRKIIELVDARAIPSSTPPQLEGE